MNTQNGFKEYHPLTNIIYFCAVMVMTVSSMNPAPVIVSFIIAYIYCIMLKGKRIHTQIMFMAIPVVIFAVFIIPLFSHNGVTPIFYINDLPVTVETIIFGLNTGCMLLAVIMWFIAAGEIIDSEKFLYLCGKIFPTIALLLSIVFRMIPLFISRYKEISQAQTGIGRNDADMKLFGRIKFMLKKISILISWSLEKSMATTISMESRGYGIGRRTTFYLFKIRRKDVYMMIYTVCLSVFPIISLLGGKFKTYYFPEINMGCYDVTRIAALVLMIVVMISPVIIEVAGWKIKIMAKDRKVDI